MLKNEFLARTGLLRLAGLILTFAEVKVERPFTVYADSESIDMSPILP